jgi:hypothetical protein
VVDEFDDVAVGVGEERVGPPGAQQAPTILGDDFAAAAV